MTGGTLLVSRAVKLHTDHKNKLEELGFKNVTVTCLEKDGLNTQINELKPNLLIIGSHFYKSATPYMVSLLKRNFKNLNIAAVSISDYPPDLAMKFIINGVNSYLDYFDGKSQFYKGLDNLREGKNFVSNSVLQRLEMRHELPPPALKLKDREIEIMRLLCNGFTSQEIADELSLSKRTIEFHKAELFNNLGTRNENELIRVALYLDLIKINELNFYGRNFTLRPKPYINKVTGGLNDYKNKKRRN